MCHLLNIRFGYFHGISSQPHSTSLSLHSIIMCWLTWNPETFHLPQFFGAEKSELDWSYLSKSWYINGKLDPIVNERCVVNFCQMMMSPIYKESYGGFLKWWYPQIIHFNRVFHYKPSILGYPYFRKHPYSCIISFRLTLPPVTSRQFKTRFFSLTKPNTETSEPDVRGVKVCQFETVTWYNPKNMDIWARWSGS